MDQETRNGDEPEGLDPRQRDEAERLIAKLRRHSKNARQLAEMMKKQKTGEI